MTDPESDFAPAAPPAPTPAEGGAYIRDPVTGALRRDDGRDAAAAQAPRADADPETGTDPEPAPRKRRRPDMES